MPPRVIVVGPMGAGKSTVAELLAQRWGLPYRDTDADIEESQGRTVSEIFVEDGEPFFRELEVAAVVAAVRDHAGVLSLGGGAVLRPETQEVLRGQPVVFLRVGLAAAVSRVGLGTSRPLLLGNVRAQIKKLLDERLPVYQAVARWEVDTDNLSPDEVADQVAALVGQP